MGRSGAAAARLLALRGYSVTGFDGSPEAVKPPHVTSLFTGDPSPGEMKGLSMLVMSPGIPPVSPVTDAANRAGVPLVGEIELAFAATEADILGVTGSNGKTTTVEWLGHLLRGTEEYSGAVVAGNMGYALCDAVVDHPEASVFAVELSSYQLESAVDLRVRSAAFLNLTPDHLARHGTMKNYGDAKARIFMNQRPEDTAVLNLDDPLLVPYRKAPRGRVLYFSLLEGVSAGAWLDGSGILRYRDGSRETAVIKGEQLSLPGRHNVANALAVICMGASLGIDPAGMSDLLASFRGVPHRLEELGTINGASWVNDSKSTNIDSLRVALESFHGDVILLAGGLAKNSDYSVLSELIRERVKLLVLFGADGGSLGEQWAGTVPSVVTDDLEEAAEIAFRDSAPGDTVLLSPGCASFDRYRNFEERGEHFRRITGRFS